MTKKNKVTEPIVAIDYENWYKLKMYTKFAKGEISGLGLVEKMGDNIFYITNVYLFKQQCTSTSTRLDQRQVALFISKMMDEGVDTSKLKLWWHTHGDMNVFWSPIDDANIEDFDVEEKEDNWLLSIVLNKDEDFIARLDLFEPIRHTIDRLDVKIMNPEYKELEMELWDEVTEKVTYEQPKKKDNNKQLIVQGNNYNYNGRYNLRKEEDEHHAY